MNSGMLTQIKKKKHVCKMIAQIVLEVLLLNRQTPDLTLAVAPTYEYKDFVKLIVVG